MERRTRLGIIVGVIYGALVLVGAAYQGLSGGALMILATTALGLGGGLIAGGLLFAMIAMCPSEEEEEPALSAHPDEYRPAA